MAANSKSSNGGRTQLAALALAAIAAWAAGLYFRMAPPGSPLVRPMPSATISSEPPVAAAGAPAASAPAVTAAAPLTTQPENDAPPPAAADGGGTAAGGATTTPTSTAAASASATAPAPPTDLTACVAALFPKDTFASHDPSFAFLCVEPYPRRGVTRMQSQVAKGKWGSGRTTAGMQEWAALGWYQLAAYTFLRGRCCPSADEYLWSFELSCPIDEALTKLEEAARTGDSAGVKASLEDYKREANCLARRGQAPNFGQKTMPGSGYTAFQRMLRRLAKGSGK